MRLGAAMLFAALLLSGCTVVPAYPAAVVVAPPPAAVFVAPRPPVVFVP
jgi:PBP1b-binding outer membrane lipoprotein LpoB